MQLACIRTLPLAGKGCNDDKNWTMAVAILHRRYMMQPVYRHFPEVKAKHHVLLDFNNLESPKGFEARMPKNATISPSSGWLGGTLWLCPLCFS